MRFRGYDGWPPGKGQGAARLRPPSRACCGISALHHAPATTPNGFPMHGPHRLATASAEAAGFQDCGARAAFRGVAVEAPAERRSSRIKASPAATISAAPASIMGVGQSPKNSQPKSSAQMMKVYW